MFFGMAVKPKSIHSSAWMFKRYAEGLDVTVLGFLQVDSQGNVNVSHRGPTPRDFVGAGGFCDIADAAKTIVFVGSWMVRGQFRVRGGKVEMIKQGRAKFVPQVDQITFNGSRALEQGKNVYYVSNVGVFKLTEAGVELQYLMPGIDLQRDVLDVSEAEVVLPT
jgi:propionate CoA-transferase